jgi:hypothetical protein
MQFLYTGHSLAICALIAYFVAYCVAYQAFLSEPYFPTVNYSPTLDLNAPDQLYRINHENVSLAPSFLHIESYSFSVTLFIAIPQS